MAIITEESAAQAQPRRRKPNPETKSSPISAPTSTSTPPKAVAATGNPFTFWFYFTVLVCLITLFSILLSSLSPPDPKTWFLNLPPNLRRHYSDGRIIKVQPAPNHPQLQVFSIQRGPTNSDSHVLIVHGLGCSSFAFRNVVEDLGSKNVHAVAIDLPGSGFSDKSVVVVEEHVGGIGVFGRFWEVYEEIKENGLFWGFDQLVEQGYVNFEEKKVRISKKERVKAIELGFEEMGRVLGQVVDSMGLAPVDLVLHDSAFGLSANWISQNPGLIRSLVVLDGAPSQTALPIWALGIPVMREIVIGFSFVFERVLAGCCVAAAARPEVESHRILLKGSDGGSAVVEMGKKLNSSFDLSEWRSQDGVKDLPIQVLWSGGWSNKWTAMGREIADVVDSAALVTHSGGRWTGEHNAEEVSKSIYEFVSSLPKFTKVVEEPVRENPHEMLSEARSCGDHHHQHHYHSHGGGAGYAEASGLGHGWVV